MSMGGQCVGYFLNAPMQIERIGSVERVVPERHDAGGFPRHLARQPRASSSTRSVGTMRLISHNAST